MIDEIQYAISDQEPKGNEPLGFTASSMDY